MHSIQLTNVTCVHFITFLPRLSCVGAVCIFSSSICLSFVIVSSSPSSVISFFRQSIHFFLGLYDHEIRFFFRHIKQILLFQPSAFVLFFVSSLYKTPIPSRPLSPIQPNLLYEVRTGIKLLYCVRKGLILDQAPSNTNKWL